MTINKEKTFSWPLRKSDREPLDFFGDLTDLKCK